MADVLGVHTYSITPWSYPFVRARCSIPTHLPNYVGRVVCYLHLPSTNTHPGMYVRVFYS